MDVRDIQPEEFKQIYSKVPRLCVDLIIKAENGVVLTLRTLPSWNNLWHLPGGGVFYKETIKDAAERVAQAELGVSVEIEKLLGYMEFFSEEKERGFGYSVSLALLCKSSSTKFNLNEAASDVKSFVKLPDNIVPEHQKFLTEHWSKIIE